MTRSSPPSFRASSVFLTFFLLFPPLFGFLAAMTILGPAAAPPHALAEVQLPQLEKCDEWWVLVARAHVLPGAVSCGCWEVVSHYCASRKT
jgi:hypothetical protein